MVINQSSNFESSIYQLFDGLSKGFSTLIKPAFEVPKAQKAADAFVLDSLEALLESQEQIADGLSDCLDTMPEGIWTVDSVSEIEGMLKKFFSEDIFASLSLPIFDTPAAKKMFIRKSLGQLFDFQIFALDVMKKQISQDSKDALDLDSIRLLRSLNKSLSLLMELSFDMAELTKIENPLTKKFKDKFTLLFRTYILSYLRLVDVLKAYVEKSDELDSKLKFLAKERLLSKGVLI